VEPRKEEEIEIRMDIQNVEWIYHTQSHQKRSRRFGKLREEKRQNKLASFELFYRKAQETNKQNPHAAIHYRF